MESQPVSGPSPAIEGHTRRVPPDRSIFVHASPLRRDFQKRLIFACASGILRYVNRQLHIPQPEIRDFCERHHIRKLSIFGSALRADFGPESDVDVLVEFEEGHVPGFDFFEMQIELSGILGRQVDLNTPSFLSHFFRDRVLREAEVQYDVA